MTVPAASGPVGAPNRGAGRQTLAVLFVDVDIEAASPFVATLGEELRAFGAGEVRLVTMWRPVVRGTSRYADELW